MKSASGNPAVNVLRALFIGFLTSVYLQPLQASEEFFVPFPEDHTLEFLQGISSDALCDAGFASPNPDQPINTVTDFVVRVEGALIVVDHHEDGYEADLEDIASGAAVPSTPLTTRIYGDGILSNGAVPGVTTDAGDVLIVGQVVVFEESIDTATQLADIEITGAVITGTGGATRTQDGVDGGDRVFATETINVTRTQWAGSFNVDDLANSQSGTLFAGAFELFPLSQWGDSFTIPVGEDSGAVEFEWTGATIMAANDGTSVSVDSNADGDFTDPGDIDAVTINRGESIEVNGQNNNLAPPATGPNSLPGLQQGARIFTSDIVQVNLISGEECSNYGSRWFTVFPDALLGNTYYEPVSTPADDQTVIYLYNPSLNAISINYELSVAAGGLQAPISVPPMSTVAQPIPADSGARFFTGSTATFGALTVTDDGDTAHDWGHASTSQRLMGNVVQVGFAQGDDPSRDDSFTFVAADGLVDWERYNGTFTDTSQIDLTGTLVATGTDTNIDLAGNAGNNFGLIHRGFINITEIGTYTFATTSDDGSRLFIDGVEVVVNDADQPPTQVTGTFNATETGWFPIEVRFREVGGGEALSAQIQAPSDAALADIPTALLSSVLPDAALGENGAPIWLIADNLEDTSDLQYQICVDVNGNGGPNTDPNTGRTFDFEFTLDRLESARVFDGGVDTPNTIPAHIDGDQSGMLIFVCDGSDAILAAAWGQDPLTASPAAPAVDVGTTVRSISDGVAFVGDTVFEDENGNGLRDPGERGIENVTVILTPPPSVNLGFGPGQPVLAATDFNGSYLFTNLLDGDYTIEIVPPASFTQTAGPDANNGDPVVLDNISTPTIADASGRLDQDFGYTNNVPSGQAGDFIYNDVNGNGIQEPGESGIAGIDVELCSDDGVPNTVVAEDDFDVQSYTNGTGSWAPAGWVELNDAPVDPATTTNAGNQGIFITPAGELSFRGNAAGPSLTRELDLSGFSVVSLNFDWRGADDAYEGGDEVRVQVSTDNGANFITLLTIEGTDIDGNTGSESVSFNSQGSANVLIRFEVNANNFFGGGENLFIDNLEVLGLPCITQTTGASGDYLFTGLAAGLYTIRVLNPPAGTTNTDDPSGDANNSNQFSLFSSGGNLEQDFGYFTPATVIGHIYFDTNGNGVQDAGEPNIPNLDVEITDSLGNLSVVTTDANGDYSATIPPGTTQVNIDNSDPDFPSGFIQTDGVDPNVVVAVAGLIVDGGDDGYFQGNVIGDTVYSEEDGTPGVQGAGDPGIPNVLVSLTPPPTVDAGAGVGVTVTTFTDVNGEYSFVGLPDGNYTVTVAQPSGSLQTEDPDGGADNQSAVLVTGGVTNNDQDFGYNNTVPVGTIGDRIYTDTNGNGVQDAGENGIAGIIVELCGDLDDNNATINTCRTEVTDADGDYLFGDNLSADLATADPADDPIPATDGSEVYTVTVLNPPAGQLNSQDPDGGLPNFSQLTLSTAGGNLEQDFGYFESGTVTGHLYIDTNGDGDQDPGEPDLVGVDVVITDANGNQQTVSTDSNGDYSAQVPPGSTTADVDESDPQYPLNHQQTEGTEPTTVTAVAGSSVDIGIDGYFPAGAIGDFIFFDSDSAGTTGVFDPGIDVGIPNVTVTLTPPAGVDLGAGAGVAIDTVTDTNGNYSFGTLPPGTYTVTVTQPSNTNATIDPDASDNGAACTTCNNSSSVVITSGLVDNDQDFGYQSIIPSGQIGDRIFNDTNGNGVQDGSEAGIEGIIVQICGDLEDDDDVTPDTCRTETTDADGDYLFGDGFAADGVTVDAADTGLPGTNGTEDYAITVLNPPAGSVNTADPDGLTPNVAQLTLPSGISNLDQDFGYTTLGAISGTVWLDEDLDGILDIEEAGITEVQVELILDGVVIAVTTSDTNGDYAFDDVLPGSYSVNVVDPTVPSGLTGTAGPAGSDPKSVVVDPGERVEDVNFGYIPNANTGAIGDRVWADADGDGIQDPGEAGIADVQLELRDATNTLIGTATTNQNGDYLFTNVPFADDYIVSINTGDAATSAALNGFTATSGPQSQGGFVSSPVTLNVGLTVVSDVDFGFDNPLTNTIVDTVWFDQDANGLFDPVNEQAISGVTVNLYNDANNDGIADDADSDGEPDVVATAITAANGQITFSGLSDGSYVLGVVDTNLVLEGLDATTPEAVSTVSDTVALSGGQTDTQTSFGYNKPGRIAGTVYGDDLIVDSDQGSGEAGFADVLVTLTPPAGVDLGNGAGVAITTYTAPDGSYVFDDVPPGDYTITVSSPGGTQTEDPDGVVNNITVVTLAAGESSIGNDFGYTGVADVFTLDGTVFVDPDKDGIEDATDVGIPDVTLDLIIPAVTIIDGFIDINGDGVANNADDGSYLGVQIIDGRADTNGDLTVGDAGDNGVVSATDIITGLFDLDGSGVVDAADDGVLPAAVIASTTSDSLGNYIFTGLANGDYQVAVTDSNVRLAGYDITSGLDVLDRTINDANISNVDFGYIAEEATGSISGEVWIDEDSDGSADDDEFNITDVEVHLCRAPLTAAGPCSPSQPTFVATQLTDARGEYSFNDLPPAQYVVSNELGDMTPEEAGDIPEGLDFTVVPPTVSLSEGEDVRNVDLGYEPAASTGVLSGVVWTDVDGNGIFDPGEAPIAGVTITVTDFDNATGVPGDFGNVVGTAVTNADGSWLLPNISGTDLSDGLLVRYDQTVPAGLGLNETQPTNFPLGDLDYLPVDLASDEDNNISSLDFGFQPLVATSLGTISGTIYVDTNQNDSYQPATDGELRGVSVDLLNGAGQVIATVLTDENGFYHFNGLLDDNYNVVVTDNANITQNLNPNAQVLPRIIAPSATGIEISGGNTVANVDAGFESSTENTFSIGDKFFFDTNNNGQLDDNEPGIEGVIVQCWLDVDQSETLNDPDAPSNTVVPQPGVDNLIRTVTTDQNGEYVCTSLPEGQYIVRVLDAGDFDEATDGATILNDVGDNFAKPWSYALALSSTSPNFTADFGVVGNNSISGFIVVEDETLVEPILGPDGDLVVLPTELDGTSSVRTVNGVAEPNPANTSPDSPAANVPVELFVEQNGEFILLLTTTTDANGFYEFGNLPDGNYRTVVQTNGSPIDGFGETGDPSLTAGLNGNGTEDLVCDTPTAALCDDQSEVISLSGGALVENVSFAYQRDFVTTPVTVNYFRSSGGNGNIEFVWETSNEVAHAGFQIYARTEGGWELISDLIESEAGDSLKTRTYTYQVTGVNAKWFSLVAVSSQEELTANGPFKLGQEYGENMVRPLAFDWTDVEIRETTVNEISNSVNNRLRRLLDAEERAARQ